MIDEPAVLAVSGARHAPLRMQLARVLRAALAAPIALATLVARALRRRRSKHAYPATAGRDSAPVIMVATSRRGSASDAADDPDVPAIERIAAEPELDELQCATAFGRLQCGGLMKLWDLCAVPVVSPDLFTRLAHSWLAPRGAVHRLAIVLRYESWAVLHEVAGRRLRALTDRGVEVAIFYEQQMPCIEHWFMGGPIVHGQLDAVLAWLRKPSQSRISSQSWRAVLDTTELLVRRFAPADQVANLLIELTAIAHALGGVGGTMNAARYAEAALHEVGDTPCATRCRALRALACVRLRAGETGAALTLLEAAITTAAVIGDRQQEASAQTEIGTHVLEAGHPERAEARFRSALALLPADHPQRASLHHRIARTLYVQGERDAEAEQHAEAALSLRRNDDSHLAALDRSLLMRICARRQGHPGTAEKRVDQSVSQSQTCHDQLL